MVASVKAIVRLDSSVLRTGLGRQVGGRAAGVDGPQSPGLLAVGDATHVHGDRGGGRGDRDGRTDRQPGGDRRHGRRHRCRDGQGLHQGG